MIMFLTILIISIILWFLKRLRLYITEEIENQDTEELANDLQQLAKQGYIEYFVLWKRNSPFNYVKCIKKNEESSFIKFKDLQDLKQKLNINDNSKHQKRC